MDLGRAVGFIAGGAAEGYGKGVVEQAKINWEKMLKDEDNARADQRQANQQQFESGQTQQKIQAEKDIATTQQTGAMARTTAEIGGHKEVAGIDAKSREKVAGIEAESRKDVTAAGMNELTKVTPDPKTGHLLGITKAGKSIDLGIDSPDEAKDLKLQTDDQGALRVVNVTSGNSRVVTDENGKPVFAQVKADPLAELLGGGAPKTGDPKTAAPQPRTSPTAAPGFGGAPTAPAAGGLDAGVDMSAPGPTGQAAPQALTPQEKQASIANARAAIAKGAPRDQVLQKLRDAGIDTSGF